MDRREILAGGAAMAIAGCGSALWSTPPLMPASKDSLAALAAAKGLLAGAALDVPWMADKQMLAAVKADCNVIGVANGFNWTRTERVKGTLDFSEAEMVYDFARASGQLTRGHNLVWSDPVIPPWVKALEGTMSAGQIGDLMTRHVIDNMSHFRGRIIHQDVVNEPIDPSGLQDRLWQRKLGEHYIDLAFAAAKEADPGCLRVLNQDWIELDSPDHAARRRQMLGLLHRLMSRGVPIQALGIEGHLQAEFRFAEKPWRDFLDEVTGMGLKLIITEYDVHDRGIAGGIAARDAAVAELARPFFEVTLSYRQCLGLVSQAYSDRYSWLKITPDKQRLDKQALRPNPLDVDYQRKPLWYAIAAAIRSAPPR